MKNPPGFRRSTLFALAFASCAGLLPAATPTISSTQKYAYGANTGWLSLREDTPTPGVGIVFGDYFLSGYAYAANFGWISFGNGTPSNGIRYQNTSASDYGVNHDGSGNLAGYAYSPNIGWISFDWATPTDANRPRVDLATGAFSGYAYSANTGWINLGTGNLTTTSMAMIDTDGDGIADAWEREHFGNLTTATATSDSDHDGASDLYEYISNTEPAVPADSLRIVSSSYNSTHKQGTFSFTTHTNRIYHLQTSSDLVTWTDSGLGTITPDATSPTVRTISWTGAAKKFIRAVASKPLP